MHVEFPRCLHGVGGKTLIVHNEEDRDRELASGHWFLRPVPDAPVGIHVGMEEARDIETPISYDEPVQVPDVPKKRGRKPSVN